MSSQLSRLANNNLKSDIIIIVVIIIIKTKNKVVTSNIQTLDITTEIVL